MPISLTTVTAVVSTLTAIMGLFVSYLAYQGYRRNESQRMRALSIGTLCIAVFPYLVAYIVDPIVNATDATMIVIVTVLHTIGLAAIYLTFDR